MASYKGKAAVALHEKVVRAVAPGLYVVAADSLDSRGIHIAVKQNHRNPEVHTGIRQIGCQGHGCDQDAVHPVLQDLVDQVLHMAFIVQIKKQDLFAHRAEPDRKLA